MSIDQTTEQPAEHTAETLNFLRSFVLGVPMQALQEYNDAPNDTTGTEE